MSSQTLNIILFGETGVGKSSVINLLAGRPVARTSTDAEGRTMNSKEYRFNVGSRQVNIWDTVGPNEPRMDVNGFYDAITRGIALIREVSEAGGVDFLLLCISGNRIRATALSNYRLFYEALCNKKVPIALVITHLERERRMEDWWERNEANILGYGIRSVQWSCLRYRSQQQWREIQGCDVGVFCPSMTTVAGSLFHRNLSSFDSFNGSHLSSQRLPPVLPRIESSVSW